MKRTLLEMAQELASSLDAEEFNSISDSTESMQIAMIIRGVYYDLATDIGLPEHEEVFQLNASGSTSFPVKMTLPARVTKTREIYYDCRDATETNPLYTPLIMKSFADFVIEQQGLREDTAGVGLMTIPFGGENYKIMYRTDKHPTYFTYAPDNTLLFDSYDSTVEATLQKSKTMCIGSMYPEFTLADAFTPDLDANQFSLLYNRAKVRAFNELKQQANQEAAGEARRQKIIIQKRKHTDPDEPAVKRNARFGRR